MIGGNERKGFQVDNRGPKKRASRSIPASMAALACTALLMPACRDGCKKTVMVARDAAVVDAGDASSSAVLEARLTAKGTPLADRKVEFHVEADGGHELVGYATTDSDGFARLDLKDYPAELVEGAGRDSYGAVFRGRGKHCGSYDEARLDLVGTS